MVTKNETAAGKIQTTFDQDTILRVDWPIPLPEMGKDTALIYSCTLSVVESSKSQDATHFCLFVE